MHGRLFGNGNFLLTSSGWHVISDRLSVDEITKIGSQVASALDKAAAFDLELA